ncbi:MAG: hypothetical protein LIO79_04245 [Rikenellaceae bacterium]|nr:hypothetical protein [Rikenellaceae bacterium]
MNKTEFYDILSTRFYGNCNHEWAELILKHDLIAEAIDIALLKTGVQPFRAAYSLETAFFKDSSVFAPYYTRFLKDYTTISNESVMRHYGKIVYHIIDRELCVIDNALLDKIAVISCGRAVESDYKIAVKVWAMYILSIIHNKIPWTAEYLPDIIETLNTNPSPGIISCLKKVRNKMK